MCENCRQATYSREKKKKLYFRAQIFYEITLTKYFVSTLAAGGKMAVDSGLVVVGLITLTYIILVFGLFFYVKNEWCELLFKNNTVGGYCACANVPAFAHAQIYYVRVAMRTRKCAFATAPIKYFIALRRRKCLFLRQKRSE
jgi:hypothetical protein